MPDRAVVTCDRCGQDVPFDPVFHQHWCESCQCWAMPLSTLADAMPDPQPRALVALSDDRQWLAYTAAEGRRWFICRQTLDKIGYAFAGRGEVDTGQDAHQVLRDFLEGRGA